MAGPTPPPGTPGPADPSSGVPPVQGWFPGSGVGSGGGNGPGGGSWGGSGGWGDTPSYGYAGAPQPPLPSRGTGARRAPVVLALVVVLALLLGGGAFAFLETDPFHLFGPGPQAAEALPADAVLYVGMDLDPTASQKIDAVRFLNHFPAFRNSAGVPDAEADVRRALVGKLVDSLHCTGIDYEHDVMPWLGKRFGFALMAPTATEPEPYVAAIQVNDESAAREGIAALETCFAKDQGVPGGSAEGVAFVNGYLLLSQTQVDADGYAEAASEHSLADDADFAADVGSLGDAGVATMWVDVRAAVSAFGDGAAQLDPLSGVTSTAQRAAATFRFGSDHVEVATSVFGDTPAVDHADNPVVKLPDSTVFALSESGGGQRIAQAWDGSIAKARADNLDLDREISDFEASSGLNLPEDLETILGSNIMVALDGVGLTSDTFGGADASRINLGARFTNDPAKLDAIYDKLLGLVDSEVDQSTPFVKLDLTDGLVIATNDRYASALGTLAGSLGETDAFRSVIDDGAHQEFVLFVDIDSVKDQILESMREGGQSASTIANLQPLRAFGVTEHVDGDYLKVTVRLSVED